MRFIIIIFILSCLTSCDKNNSTYVDEFSVIIHEHDYYSKKYDTYIPNKQDISKGLKLFRQKIDSSDQLFNIPSDILDSVYKQYFGYYEKGNKILIINCLCELWESPEEVDYFNQRLSIPNDGGFCYFQGYVDMTNDTVRLSVNGDL
ncbi:MAG TPA: hypothetical protein PKL31_16425 [Fulvivirga sp.]|nr:hypothetical protein [Fulvivirga sp.]